MIPKKCRVEQLLPENDWTKSYYFARLRGISNQIKSFNFKMLHKILPFKERLHQMLPNTSPMCSLCDNLFPETPIHGLFQCRKNSQAAQVLISLTKPYDSSITPTKALMFDITTRDNIYELPVTLVLSTGLHFIWENRINKKGTTVFGIRSEIECLISLLRRSRTQKLKEAGEMIGNTLENFQI